MYVKSVYVWEEVKCHAQTHYITAVPSTDNTQKNLNIKGKCCNTPQ